MAGYFKTITVVSNIAAGLCVLGLPLWILGVPGTDGEYARGWRMGLNVLLALPLAWLLNFASLFVMRGRLSDAAREQWQAASGALAVAVLVAAVARLVQAFRIMP